MCYCCYNNVNFTCMYLETQRKPGNSEKAMVKKRLEYSWTWSHSVAVLSQCWPWVYLGLWKPFKHFVIYNISSKTFKALAFFSPLRLTSFQGLQDPVGTFCIASAFITLSHQRVALLLFTLSSKLCRSIWSHDAPDIF